MTSEGGYGDVGGVFSRRNEGLATKDLISAPSKANAFWETLMKCAE